MKKILLMALMFFPCALFSQEAGKVVVYDFVNSSSAAHVDYFSQILPASVAKALGRVKYNALRVNESIGISDETSPLYAAFLSSLKERAAAQNADYLVIGSFSLDQNVLSVTTAIYIRRNEKILQVTSSQNAGPFLDKIIDEVSEKTAYYIDRYIPRMTKEPIFVPAKARFEERGTIEIKAQSEETKLYYTTDGSNPDIKKNAKNTKEYTAPIVIDDDVIVKAVAVREGWFPSAPSRQKFTIVRTDNHVIFSALMGTPVFLLDSGSDMNKSTGSIFSLKCDVPFARMGLSSVKNGYLLMQYDAFLAESSDSSSTQAQYSAYGGLIGLMYQIRFGKYFRIEPDLGGGYAWGYMKQDTEMKKKALFIPSRSSEEVKGFYGNASLTTSFVFGAISAGINVSYRVYDFDERLHMLGYSLIVSMRF